MLREGQTGRPRQNLPRVVLLLFEVYDVEALQQTLGRIPASARDCLEEVVVVLEDSRDFSLPPSAPGSEFALRVHRGPRRTSGQSYGACRKGAFEYALQRGFEIAVQLRVGRHPPELLPQLIAPLSDASAEVSIAQRGSTGAGVSRTGRSLWRGLGGAGASVILNRLLGLREPDPASSYRAVSVHALRDIPFQLNSDGRAFDTQLLIQCRALGLRTQGVEADTHWQEGDDAWASLRAGIGAICSAIDYRCHQLHFSRRGRYLLDTGSQYTLKQSPSGSHAQIAEAIESGSHVLDLGCSQGLLARPLTAKGVQVTGVDIARSERLAQELGDFHERDLERPLDLPTGRIFDYVVISDVLEHLKERQQLLRGARRYLREGGRLIVSTPNIALWFYRLSLLLGRFEYGPRGVLDRTHVHLYTRSTFRREIEAAGFRIEKERVTALPFEVVFASTGRSSLVRNLAGSYHLLARLWPELFAYQFILEARITTLDEEAVAP